MFRYRLHDAQYSRTSKGVAGPRARLKLLERLGLDQAAGCPELLETLGRGITCDGNTLARVSAWIDCLSAANRRTGLFGQQALAAAIDRKWLTLCSNSARLGLTAWRVYRSNPVSGAAIMPRDLKVEFFLKCLRRAGKEIPAFARFRAWRRIAGKLLARLARATKREG